MQTQQAKHIFHGSKSFQDFQETGPKVKIMLRCSSNLMCCFLCLQGILRCWIKGILVLNAITEKIKHLSNTNNIVNTS